MILLEMKCPQLSKPEATEARNENSIGDRMEKKLLTAQAREAAIVILTQRQAMTTSRNARVTRCLKQDPTRLYKDAKSNLPDATSSLKRRTCECSFREKTILAC